MGRHLVSACIWTNALLSLAMMVSAQETCSSRHFICTNGDCIPSGKRCDGNNDCADRSDENCCVQNSNSGKEFVLAFMSTVLMNVDHEAYFALFLTSVKALNFTIEAPSEDFKVTDFLEANELKTIQIPTSLMLNSGIENKGILVTSTEDVTVYGLNQQIYTTDAFLALPTTVQGQEYVIASYTGESRLAVVGIQDNTSVTILLSSPSSDGTNSYIQGQKVSYKINRLQTLQLTGDDLTGSIVSSDKPVSVFGGHRCANVPVGIGACDHLVEQLPPVTTFGKSFATVPLATRTAGDIFRVVAPYNNTNVIVDGVVQGSINSGQFYEIDTLSSRYVSIDATKPVLLLQYCKGTQADNVLSDPFMVMIPTIEQYRSRYMISTPSAFPVTFESYLNLIIDQNEISGLRLDDNLLPNSVQWHTIPGKSLVGAFISVVNGSHRLHHVRKEKFGVIIYGYASFDSYGYPGGLQLEGECVVDSVVVTDTNECDDQHPCEQTCINTIGSFQCACNKGFALQPDLRTCTSTTEECTCSANGICRSDGFCLCHPGWAGRLCDQPTCYLTSECSGNGRCVAPNTCQCSKGWVGSHCSVNVCPHYSSCSTCTANEACGWCETEQRCMDGDGYSPSDTDQRCPAWFFHHCVTIGIQSSYSSFSQRIHLIDCQRDCLDESVQYRGNSLEVPGSKLWCKRWRRACTNFQKCFKVIQNQPCTKGDVSGTCLVPSEDDCPGGFPPPSDIDPPQKDIEKPPKQKDVREIVLDFNFHIICATKQDPTAWKNYGCYCVTDELSRDRRLSPRKVVDVTDECCSKRHLCYSEETPEWCDCYTAASTIRKAPCGKWEEERGFCKYLPDDRNSSACKKPCCNCDFKAAQCLKDHSNSKNDLKWSEWLDVSKGQCTPNIGTVPDCSAYPICSGHGVLDGQGNDAFCLCHPGWKGQCCGQPDCQCGGDGSHDCSGNGVCYGSTGDSKPKCFCQSQWIGRCCDRRRRIRRSGDPHLTSADGLEFDYFGIGEFWDCRSKSNDFGAQIRFFKYQSTSFAGAVAIKTGNVTTTIYTLNTSSSVNSLPKTRIAGSLLSDQWQDYPTTYSLASDFMKLYTQPTRANGSLVTYLFQFDSGASYAVDVRYSSMLGRQYLNTEFGPTVAFVGQTEGLCGFLDDDSSNDLTGPNSQIFTDTDDFAESWRVDQTVSNKGDGSWSWVNSNFHPDDPLDFSYTDPSHRAVYGLSQLDDTIRLEADSVCTGRGLRGTLLENCILDLSLTGDATVVEQQAFQQGKCPNDCSNHGQCANGTCICVSTWTGEDCSKGGCDSCPLNSRCIDGFCHCNIGYFGTECAKAFCDNVNNCTSPVHGICVETDICKCSPGYQGTDCSIIATCPGNCSSHGICMGGGKCLCEFGWGGQICSAKTCESLNFCSGNGKCDTNGTCHCNSGWKGSACNLFSCDSLNDCFDNGECIGNNECACFVGYRGLACNETSSCPQAKNCSGNGVCQDETICECYSGYHGDTCDKFECTQGCSGRGTCVAPELCSCNSGWTGVDCSVASCERLHYCSGHGRCTGLDRCACDDDWSGPICDIVACNSGNRTGNCSGNGLCVSSGLCSCNATYCGDDCQFEVADECAITPRLCHHTCTDTCESYECSCNSGYLLLDDESTCQDIDECNITYHNNCDQLCVNIPGSFVCNCTTGYYLAQDGGSCIDIDECNKDSGCDHLCINTVGSYNCSCNSGYTLNSDGKSCEDVDECSLGTDNCKYPTVCSNTEGSYKCQPSEVTFRWKRTRWSNCSVRRVCGEGVTTRQVTCVESNSTSGAKKIVSDDVCISLVRRKLKQRRRCGSPCHYATGDWSICGSDCVRKRQIQCEKRMRRGKIKPLKLRHCNADVDIPLPRPPPNAEVCSGRLCQVIG